MQYRFEMLPNEYWWGGTVGSAECPLTAASDYHQDFRRSGSNQTMPLFLSNLGRCIWSDQPFKVDVVGGGKFAPREPVNAIALGQQHIRDGKPDLNMLFIYNMPFRGIAKMMNGMVSMDMAEGILLMANGHFFKGLAQTVGGFFRRPSLKKYKGDK